MPPEHDGFGASGTSPGSLCQCLTPRGEEMFLPAPSEPPPGAVLGRRRGRPSVPSAPSLRAPLAQLAKLLTAGTQPHQARSCCS